jgi:hypothetical protein
MPVMLVKLSSPGWDKEFPDLPSAVTELREHVCSDCLAGNPDEGGPALDREEDGRKVECRDAMMLLATACGCRFTLEGDHGLWPEVD